MTTDNYCFYLQNRLIQTSQTGGQQYSDPSPFSIPWFVHSKVKPDLPGAVMTRRQRERRAKRAPGESGRSKLPNPELSNTSCWSGPGSVPTN